MTMALLASSLNVSASDAEVELRVNAHIPFSPFAHVTYELKHVGETPAVALTRFHAGEYGSDSEVELVSDELFHEAWEMIAACLAGPFALNSPNEVTTPWIELYAVRDGQEIRGIIRSDESSDAHDACLAAVRLAVLPHLQVEPYQMPYWDAGEFGTLRATANLPARLYVDDQATGLITPVNALRLDPGVREIRWVGVVTRQEVVRSVTVVEGMTTQVFAEFEPQALDAELSQ
jgi:hypothetical protein